MRLPVWVSALAYRLNKLAERQLLLPYWQCQVQGLGHLPEQGPAILVSNHPTILDGHALDQVIPRRVDFLVSQDVLRFPLIGPWLRVAGVIPADRRCLLQARGRLRRGACLGIFPEGAQTHSYQLENFQSGAAWLARRTGAPVIPVGMVGGEALCPGDATYLKGGPLRIRLGAPLVCGRDEPTALFLERLRRAVEAQIDLAEPLPALRRDMRFRLAQLFWVPTSWWIFHLADAVKPGGRR